MVEHPLPRHRKACGLRTNPPPLWMIRDKHSRKFRLLHGSCIVFYLREGKNSETRWNSIVWIPQKMRRWFHCQAALLCIYGAKEEASSGHSNCASTSVSVNKTQKAETVKAAEAGTAWDGRSAVFTAMLQPVPLPQQQQQQSVQAKWYGHASFAQNVTL